MTRPKRCACGWRSRSRRADLLDHYRRAGKLKDVDGRPPVPEVTEKIIEALGIGAGVQGLR